MLLRSKPEANPFGLLLLDDHAAMPSAPPRPCRHPACSKLVIDGNGYCPDHKRDRNINRYAGDNRGSRHERGYGTAWQKLRVIILKRDSGLCQPCLKIGRVTAAKQVDHIIQKSEGGTDDESNLQSICVACHKTKTAKEAAHGRGASKVQIDFG
jgi:5-methylcytosine-specific restriction enzyme A